MSGFWYGFWLENGLDIVEEAPQECLWMGARRGLHLSNAVVDDSCCNVALLVISLLGIGLLQQVPIVSGDARLAITNGEPDKH